MKDDNKTKKQLKSELEQMRQRICALEESLRKAHDESELNIHERTAKLNKLNI